MVTILGFILVVAAFIYYACVVTSYSYDAETQHDEVKKTAMLIGIVGCGLVIANSWIVSPILRMIGG